VNEDFEDMLAALLASGARFLVVGAHVSGTSVRPADSGTWRTWNGWRSSRVEVDVALTAGEAARGRGAL
jgi:hypothetical protein